MRTQGWYARCLLYLHGEVCQCVRICKLHQLLSYKSFYKAFIFCQIGYISGIIYYLISGQKSLSRSETSLPDWKTDTSCVSYWKAEILCDDGNAKWHFSSDKWQMERINMSQWATEWIYVQTSFEVASVTLPCQFRENSICRHQLSETVIGLVKRPICF